MNRIFLETIMVSRYCLKFLYSKSCSYWIKGAFIKVILASGGGSPDPAAKTFFDSNNFFKSVSVFKENFFSRSMK